jgi:hypothetical protein
VEQERKQEGKEEGRRGDGDHYSSTNSYEGTNKRLSQELQFPTYEVRTPSRQLFCALDVSDTRHTLVGTTYRVFRQIFGMCRHSDSSGQSVPLDILSEKRVVDLLSQLHVLSWAILLL